MHFVRLSGIVGVSIDRIICFVLSKDCVVVVSEGRAIAQPVPVAFVTHGFSFS
jgi:hypothetical protein